MSFGTNSKLSMRQETRQNLVLRLSLSAEKQNGDKGRHYRALLTYWLNTFFENQCCRPERFHRYSVFPNMQGDFDGYFDFKTATGTFSTANPNDTIQALTTGIQGNHGIKFNASKVNTIFGSSDTVQPKTLRGYALIRYV